MSKSPACSMVFRRDSHPMAVLCGVTGALAAFYHDALDVSNPVHRDITAYRLLSKMPTVAAMCVTSTP